MNFFEDPVIAQQLFPFTLTRSAADIRIGITTIREKWLRLQQHTAGRSIPSHIIPQSDTPEALRQGKHMEEAHTISLQFPWQIFEYNDRVLRSDFQQLTGGRKSAQIPVSNRVIAEENIFLEEGA